MSTIRQPSGFCVALHKLSGRVSLRCKSTVLCRVSGLSDIVASEHKHKVSGISEYCQVLRCVSDYKASGDLRLYESVP